MRIRIVVACWLAVTVLGCAGTVGRGHSVETVGGIRTVRPFASATAYEAFVQGEVAHAHGDDADARRRYALATFAAPDDEALAIESARACARAGAADRARETIDRVARARPDDAAVQVALAEVRLASGDTAGAHAAATRALGLAPDDADVRAVVVRVDGGDEAQVASARANAPGSSAGDRTDARRVSHAPSTTADLASVRDRRAREAMQRGDWGAVERWLGALVADERATPAERRVLFAARLRDGRPDDAARLIPAIALLPVPGGVSRAERAGLWLACRRDDTAADEATHALIADPDDADARFVLGAALVQGTDVARGLSLLALVPPGDHHFVAARTQSAQALARTGHPLLAVRVLDHAIERLPADAVAARDELTAARAALTAASAPAPAH